MKRLSAFRLILILIVLGLVAISILFGVLAFKSQGKEDELADQVNEVEVNIARLGQLSDIDALQAEIDNLLAQLGDVPFPIYVDDNAIFGLVQQSAATADVTIETWALGGVSVQPIDGSALGYQVYHYRVEASGALSNIFVFLSEMEENSPYDTAKLEDVELTYDDGSDSWSIEFDILVYAQP